jgi:hypothetical protein
MNYTILSRSPIKQRFVNGLCQYNNINKTIKKSTCTNAANTYKNGLAFEKKVSNLIKPYVQNLYIGNDGFISFKFKEYNNDYKLLKGKHLMKYMNQYNLFDINIKQLSGCKCPDQAYYCPETKSLSIIEIKHQQGSGSVNQKLTGTPQYIDNYQKQYPYCNIKYMYIFSNWFFENSKPELELLDQYNIPYYSTSIDNIKKLIKYICN